MNKRYLLYLLVFCVGALSQYDLTILARVPASEVLAFASIPFLLLGLNLGPIKEKLGVVALLMGAWLGAILVSDVMNGFDFARAVRGAMKPVFCLFWTVFFVGIVMREFKALAAYPIGKVLAALQNYVAPQDWTADRIMAGGYEAVAYGVVPIVSALCLVFAVLTYRKGRFWAILAFVVSAIVLVFAGAPRSSIAVVFLNAGLIGYIAWVHRGGRLRKPLSCGGRLLLGSRVWWLSVCSTTRMYLRHRAG